MNIEKLVILTNEKNWLEGLAINQAREVAKLQGVTSVYAMPDLHAGKVPIGVSVVTKDKIYPHLIGTDIGCGMSLYNTGILKRKIKIEKWVSKLNTIKSLSVVPNLRYYPNCPISDFGTIGSGNHFCEFQTIHKVENSKILVDLGVDANQVLMCVHSGSRSYGSKIFSKFCNYSGYNLDEKEAHQYIIEHNEALKWAELNRDEVVDKIIGYLGFSQNPIKILTCTHNFMEIQDKNCYHRKGVVSSKDKAVVIAGSHGTLSYLVSPTAKCAEYGFSLAHGSGRKWARSMCKSRIKNKYDNIIDLKQNKYNGMLVCHDYDLLFEEAPEAYKNIDNIIENLLDYGLIEVIASLKPVLTFKG